MRAFDEFTRRANKYTFWHIGIIAPEQSEMAEIGRSQRESVVL